MLLRHIEVVKAEASRTTKEGQVLAKAKSQPSFETLVRKLSDIVRGEGRLRGVELHPVNEIAPPSSRSKRGAPLRARSGTSQ